MRPPGYAEVRRRLPSPNYRGSDNRGNAYQRAIFNDAGDGPGRDVLAGVDALVKKGFVDASRMAVSGWSYGGYMTSWLIGHDTRWKAAVAGAPVTDLADQYAFSDFNVQIRYAMKGDATPFSAGGDALYRAQSPITYATRAKTPTLILSDTGDFRVPYTQGVQALPRAQGSGSRDLVRRDSHRGPLPGRPGAHPRGLPPLDRLARAAAEIARPAPATTLLG